MRKNRLIGILLCLAMVLPMLCIQASASDYNVSGAVTNYLKKGDYFSIYPSSPEYTTYALTAERSAILNQVEKGSDVQLWSIGTGKWCVQRENNGVMAIMYVENREDHKGGDSGNSPKFWALDGNKTSSGTRIHMWEDDNANDKEKTFYLEEDNDGDPETYYICSAHAYNKNGARYIVPSSTNFSNGTKVQLGSSGYHWRISIVSRATDANDNINWMSQLDGNTLLSNVNIPGTHDSSTANVKASYAENANNYTCQMHFIDEQLNCGVRAFDIRYCKNGDNVYTCHGSGDIRCATPEYDGSNAMSVDWVMGKMTAFLNPNDENNKSKNETIIMVVKQDDSNKDAPGVMAQTLLKYKDYLYDWSDPSPTLSKVRGKIVIMSRTDFSSVVDAGDLKYFGPTLTNWDDAYEDNDHWAQKIGSSSDPVQVYIQDDYNCTDYNKMVQVENVIKQLSGKTDFKEVDSDDVSRIPSIPETAFCFNYSSKAYGDVDLNPLGSARTMNSWLYSDASKYFKNGGYRTGITMTDYCDEVLCDLIIASNAGSKSHTCLFDDVTLTDWFHDFAEQAAELGLMNGTGVRQFSPQQTMSSAMAVQILYNREGQPDVTIEDGFSPDLWYAKAASWAVQQNIVQGDRINDEIAMPRQEMFRMMYTYAQLKGYDTSATADLSGFVDADQISPDAKDAVSWAVGTGIIGGDDQHRLLPEDGILRAEAAKVFVNFAGFYA